MQNDHLVIDLDQVSWERERRTKSKARYDYSCVHLVWTWKMCFSFLIFDGLVVLMQRNLSLSTLTYDCNCIHVVALMHLFCMWRFDINDWWCAERRLCETRVHLHVSSISFLWFFFLALNLCCDLSKIFTDDWQRFSNIVEEKPKWAFEKLKGNNIVL